jgi:thioesterase domain-containing protein
MKAVDRLDRQIRMLFLPRVLREQFKMTGEDSRTVGSINIPRAIRDVQVGITQAARSYTLHPYAGPVTLFRATNQPPDIYNDPTNGWGELVLGGLEILDVPGHHGAIVREPRVRLLAEKLNACLESAQSASRNGRGSPRAPMDDELASVNAASLDFALIGAGASGDTAAAGSASSSR